MKIPNFKIGDKVVCINDDFSLALKEYAYTEFMKFPEMMKIYTIRDLPLESCYLEEIVNPKLSYYNLQEPGFYRWRFVKLDHKTEKGAEVNKNDAATAQKKTKPVIKKKQLLTVEKN
jgi:hypothetical protein